MTTEDEESHPDTDEGLEQAGREWRTYIRFALMIGTSTVVMFALTYTNAFAVGHVWRSEERLYMALLMGAAMSLVMLAFMRSTMYQNRTLNGDRGRGTGSRRRLAVSVPVPGPGR